MMMNIEILLLFMFERHILLGYDQVLVGLRDISAYFPSSAGLRTHHGKGVDR